MAMHPRQYTTELISRKRLSNSTIECRLSKPSGFSFVPGQRIRLKSDALERDYSLASAPAESTLALCVREIPGGRFSQLIANAALGNRWSVSGPQGYFIHRQTDRLSVFVATGTGIAPFAAMARSGVKGFVLLHGVRNREELYYADLFRATAGAYIPCISGETAVSKQFFPGRVTAYLQNHLKSGEYDFYLCGREQMIRDATWIVDDRFANSRVFTEVFF